MKRFSQIFTKDCSFPASQAMLNGIGYKRKNYPKSKFGIHSVGYDGNPCNNHLDELANIIKQYSLEHKELFPLRFNSIGVSDGITMGTKGMRYSLLSRDLIAQSIETMMAAHYYDAGVSLVGCDKNMPGATIAALRLDRPYILCYGGSIMPGCYKGKTIDIVSAFQTSGEIKAGKITEEEQIELLDHACPTSGGCGGMYTANTMSVLLETAGMMLPYSSSNMAISKEKIKEMESVPKYMVELLKRDIRPSHILTRESLINGIVTAIALGGSTNLVLHCLAIAKAGNIDFTIDEFNKIGKNVPVFGNLKPFGEYVMYDIYKMGGTPLVQKWFLLLAYL